MVKHSHHKFIKISIIYDRELLDWLKKLVMTNLLTPEVMTVATRILPEIRMAQQLANILDVLTNLVQKFGEHGSNNWMEKVEEALDIKARESGRVAYGEQIQRNIGEP